MEQPTISPNIPHVASHPYRFVFLDGCKTASGNICESFGIPAMTLSTNNFAASGVESRAFIGFSREIQFNAGQWSWRSIMLGDFFDAWEHGNALQACVGAAQQATFQPMDSSAVIFGAYDMTIRTKTRP